MDAPGDHGARDLRQRRRVGNREERRRHDLGDETAAVLDRECPEVLGVVELLRSAGRARGRLAVAASPGRRCRRGSRRRSAGRPRPRTGAPEMHFSVKYDASSWTVQFSRTARTGWIMTSRAVFISCLSARSFPRAPRARHSAAESIVTRVGWRGDAAGGARARGALSRALRGGSRGPRSASGSFFRSTCGTRRTRRREAKRLGEIARALASDLLDIRGTLVFSSNGEEGNFLHNLAVFFGSRGPAERPRCRPSYYSKNLPTPATGALTWRRGLASSTTGATPSRISRARGRTSSRRSRPTSGRSPCATRRARSRGA